MTAIEPERGRGVVDRDLPDGERRSGGVDELIARVDTSDSAGRVGDVGAGRGEGGLGDGVVLVQELELDHIAVRNTRNPERMEIRTRS